MAGKFENEIDVLALVDRFGWLRPAEIGAALAPHDKLPRAARARVIDRLVDACQLAREKLPDGGGTWLRLTATGAARLVAEGITPGTRVKAVLPGKWRHDLIAAAVLIGSLRPYLTEREIRRLPWRSEKLPDGLIDNGDGSWTWVEVEQHRKTGKPYRSLLYWANRAAEGMQWRGLYVKGFALVCPARRGLGHYEKFRQAAQNFLEGLIQIRVISGVQGQRGGWVTMTDKFELIGPDWRQRGVDSFRQYYAHGQGGPGSIMSGTLRWQGRLVDWQVSVAEDGERRGRAGPENIPFEWPDGADLAQAVVDALDAADRLDF